MRNSSIELMRIIAMSMVLLHHFCGQVVGFQFYTVGGGSYIKTINWIPVIFMESFTIVAVNVFILISGYFSIKLRLSSVLKFVIVCSLFLMFHLFFRVVYLKEPLMNYMQIIMPITKNSAWFVKCYFMLMLLSPILNKAFASITKQQALIMAISFFVINIYMGFIHRNPINSDGYTVSQMIFIYFIGRLMNLFSIPQKLTRCKWGYLYILLSFILALGICISVKYAPKEAFRLLSYNNPLVIISSICFFSIFILGHFENRILNYLATGAFGIYLIHQNYIFWIKYFVPRMRDYYYDNGLFVFASLSIGAIVIFILFGLLLNIFFNSIVKMMFSIRFISHMLTKCDCYIKSNFS